VKFGDDIFTHPPNDPQLWVDVVAGDRPNKNYIDGVLMALAREIRVSRTILILGTLYSSSSNISQNFDELV